MDHDADVMEAIEALSEGPDPAEVGRRMNDADLDRRMNDPRRPILEAEGPVHNPRPIEALNGGEDSA